MQIQLIPLLAISDVPTDNAVLNVDVIALRQAFILSPPVWPETNRALFAWCLLCINGIVFLRLLFFFFLTPHFVSFLYVVGWSYSLFLWTAELNSILWAFHSLLFCFPGRTFSSSQQCCYKQAGVHDFCKACRPEEDSWVSFTRSFQKRGGF